MFNNQFMLLATLFGAKVRCVKQVSQVIEGKDFPVYVVGDVLTVTGVLMAEEGLSVFLREEGIALLDSECGALEDNVKLSVIQDNFVIDQRMEGPLFNPAIR